MKNGWMVRAAGGELIEDFRAKDCVAVGWSEMGDATDLDDAGLRSKLIATYEHVPRQAISAYLGILRCYFSIVKGDTIVTYDPDAREYWVSEAKGVVEYKPRKIGSDYPNVIAVVWRGHLRRDDLSVPAKNCLASGRTVFAIPPEVLDEVTSLLEGKSGVEKGRIEEEAELESLKEDIEDRADELIKDMLASISPDDLPKVVAGLIRAMGYKTVISPKGPDLGKDIVASVDPLGVGRPKIKVEVKHRLQGPASAPELRSFIGGLRDYYDAGLYVSTGGFSKETKYEAERAAILVNMFDLEGLLSLIKNHYDELDTETRSLIPLVKVYWPLKVGV